MRSIRTPTIASATSRRTSNVRESRTLSGRSPPCHRPRAQSLCPRREDRLLARLVGAEEATEVSPEAGRATGAKVPESDPVKGSDHGRRPGSDPLLLAADELELGLGDDDPGRIGPG